MAEHQRIVEQTRRRIGLVLGMRTAVAFLSGWLLVWGTLVLVLRAGLAVPRVPLLWGLAGILVAAGVGIWKGIRHCPSSMTVRALLDQHWHSGGLLMASAESNVAGWEISPPAAALPRVQWNGMRQFGLLGCCLLFAAASFLVPARILNPLHAQRLQVAAEVEKLAEQIELLKEEKVLPPERAQSLEEALKQLQHEAAGNDPGKTWEAMDHLEQSITKASAEAAEKSLRNAQKSAQAEELAAALDQAGDRMQASDLAAAMSQLAMNIGNAAEEDELLAETLSQELQEQLKNGTLDQEQLAELAKKLGECKQCNLSRIGKLASGRMIDPSRLSELNGKFQIDPDALAKLLCECKGSKEVQACLLACNKPGRGGVTRGRGDAAMTWTDGSSRDEMQFKEKALPPGAIASLKDARLQGISKADPTSETPHPVNAGGALDAGNAGRGSARTQVVLPEHKRVVQRYFDRD